MLHLIFLCPIKSFQCTITSTFSTSRMSLALTLLLVPFLFLCLFLYLPLLSLLLFLAPITKVTNVTKTITRKKSSESTRDQDYELHQPQPH